MSPCSRSSALPDSVSPCAGKVHVFQVSVAMGDGGSERLVRPGRQSLDRSRRIGKKKEENVGDKEAARGKEGGWQKAAKKTQVPLWGLFGI